MHAPISNMSSSELAPPVYVETANFDEEDVPWPVVLELRDFRSYHNGREEDVSDIARVESYVICAILPRSYL